MIDLEKIISIVKDNHIYIQMHNFPDPDAIASAYGLQNLLAHKQINSTICYKGKADCGSMNAMIRLLGINIVEYSELSNMTEAAKIILVDAQKGNANIIDMPGEEIICIDHHPTYEQADYIYSDIRPEVGACASIIAQYFFDNDVIIDKNVATALLYGIKIDTANMTRGVSELDLDMFYRIYGLADKKLISELDNSVLRQTDLKHYANAIESINTINRISFANTGVDCPDAIIASISDFIMQLDTTDITVVYSIKRDGIKISFRSSNGFNVGKAANKALSGIGSGGGHENMAGGFVWYDKEVDRPFENTEYIKQLLNEIQSRFMRCAENTQL